LRTSAQIDQNRCAADPQSSAAYFGSPQWEHFRAKKLLLYHQVATNGFPHLGQGQVEKRNPTTNDITVQTNNTTIQAPEKTKRGMRLPKALLTIIASKYVVGR
jgi:hypothetical protein